MLSRATLAFLAVLLAALLAALRLAGPAPTDRSASAAASASAPLLPAVARDPVFIRVERGAGEESFSLARSGAAWRFDAPKAGRADGPRVRRLVAALAEAAPQDRVTARQRKTRKLEWRDYGFGDDGKEARATVSFVDASRRGATVSFGSDAPGGGVFARLDGRDDVFVLAREAFDAVPATTDELRDRSLLGSGGEPPATLEIRRPGRHALRLESDAAGRWSVTAPFRGPADAAAADRIVRAVAGATVRRFVHAPAPNESPENTFVAHALAPDDIVLSLAVWRRNDSRPETFRFGGADPTDASLALVAAGPEGLVCSVDRSLPEILGVDPVELRDRRLLPAETEAVAAFETQNEGSSFRLERGEDGAWRFVRPIPAPADAGRVEAFLADAVSWRDEDALAPPFLPAADTNDWTLALETAAAGVLRARFRRPAPDTPWTDAEDGSGLIRTLPPETDPPQLLSPAVFRSLRDRTVLALPSGSVLALSRLGEGASPTNAAPVARRLSGGEWENAESAGPDVPAPDPDVAARVANLCEGFVAADVAALATDDSAAFGFLPPRAEWRISTSVTNRPVVLLQLGAALPDGSAWVRVKGDDPVFVASPDDAATLGASLFPESPTPLSLP